MEFPEAARLTHEVIASTGLEIRTLDALAALQS
jgi:hypothetical protein